MTAEMSKGQRGGGKFKNFDSKVHYLNIQDCTGGLGHEVLRKDAFRGVHFSVYKTQLYHADKEGRTLPWVSWFQVTQCAPGTDKLTEWKSLHDSKADHQAILKVSFWKASPCVGTGCFFAGAFLSLPDNFLGGVTWGCLQLLLADSGNLSRENFCGGFAD